MNNNNKNNNIIASSSMAARHRKPRNDETDPNPMLRSKPTISSILLSNGEATTTTTTTQKKKNFSTATFRGLGCTASSSSSSQVSVPAAVIRTSANWEPKKLKNKRRINNNLKNNNNNCAEQQSLSCVGVPTDVWCGPDAASVDCVVSTRPATTARGKLDVPVRSSYTARRMVTPEDNIPFLHTDSALVMPRFRPADIIPLSRNHRHAPTATHGFGQGLSEIVMLQSNLLMGGRLDGLDRYRNLRLDIDNMSYEELLELGDKIGYVSTGLGEDDMTSCLRRSKITLMNDLSSLFATEMERKCSICQEDYEQDDETGKLNCGHFYHIECIKQWLEHKNICPICKKAAVSQT